MMIGANTLIKHWKNWGNKRLAAQAMLIFAGVAALAVGVVRKEHMIILQKAIYICLECIGIG